MPLNLAMSISNLCSNAFKYLDVLKSHPRVLAHYGFGFQDNHLFFDLGHSQGFVVIYPECNKAYKVFELSETPSDNYLCEPALAELVFQKLDAALFSIGITILSGDEEEEEYDLHGSI